MFGRRPPPDNDAVALARRRLAALAAQFEPARARGELPWGSDGSARSDVRVRLDGTDWRDTDGGDPDDLGDWVSRLDDGGGGTRSATGSGSSVAGRHVTRAATREYGGWGLAPQHVTLLALLLAAVLALTAWFVLRSAPHAAPVQLTNERTVPSTAGATSQTPGTSASPDPAAAGGALVTPAGGALGTPAPAGQTSPELLVVDVTGKVRRPGIVELPAGSRVVDALHAAGGARPGVRISTLNLARPLVDGEQIVVGLKVPPVNLVPSPAVTGSSTAAAITPVDLNTATQEQLETLPGIGPVTAASILQWRTENGAFTSVDQLLDVSGIGDVTLANIKAYVHV